ncbi:hypothetical protein AGLY_002208 [Aphis glycines]|uniref:Uncharacterized protein n=1 Tax=Aphis glycines TaxID=307491 RepID=A0A6G0U2R5_APHGL|nr:hypothetical protein AGLY_002208 [Aphis glycines]
MVSGLDEATANNICQTVIYKSFRLPVTWVLLLNIVHCKAVTEGFRGPDLTEFFSVTALIRRSLKKLFGYELVLLNSCAHFKFYSENLGEVQQLNLKTNKSFQEKFSFKNRCQKYCNILFSQMYKRVYNYLTQTGQTHSLNLFWGPINVRNVFPGKWLIITHNLVLNFSMNKFWCFFKPLVIRTFNCSNLNNTSRTTTPDQQKSLVNYSIGECRTCVPLIIPAPPRFTPNTLALEHNMIHNNFLNFLTSGVEYHHRTHKMTLIKYRLFKT